MVLSVSGSLTMTVWKRRSSALSFSKYFLVFVQRGGTDTPQLAPCQSRLQYVGHPWHPRPFPAPTNVWISSMKRMMRPSLFVTSLMTDFRRSSNSPFVFGTGNQRTHVEGVELFVFQVFRYVAPQDTMGQSFHDGPSCPYPVQPINIGLFFVRRLRFAARAVSLRPVR